jgi:hypothetical protein
MQRLTCWIAHIKMEITNNNMTSPVNLQSHAPELSIFIMCGQIVFQSQDMQTALVSYIQNTIRRNSEG